MDSVPAALLARHDLLAAGVTERELRRSLRAGEMAVVRPGAYVAAGDERLRDAQARHALLVAATVARLHPDAVVSHVSAAVLHGLPVWGIPLDRVHATRARRSGARRGGVAHLHAAALDGDEIVVVGGVPVTSPARTLVDLARTVPFESAVVTADAALRAGLSRSGTALDAALLRASHRPGISAARRAVAFADGRSESVGESRSRAALARFGVPAPELQDKVWSADGESLGRVDFRWRGTVGEFDGRMKYGRLLRPGQEPGDAVFEEKRREDAIRDAGLQVVRWVWDELGRFDLVVPRLLRAFARA